MISRHVLVKLQNKLEVNPDTMGCTIVLIEKTAISIVDRGYAFSKNYGKIIFIVEAGASLGEFIESLHIDTIPPYKIPAPDGKYNHHKTYDKVHPPSSLDRHRYDAPPSSDKGH